MTVAVGNKKKQLKEELNHRGEISRLEKKQTGEKESKLKKKAYSKSYSSKKAGKESRRSQLSRQK